MVELAREQAMVIGASRDAQAKASSLTAAAVGASLGAGIVISCRNLKRLNLSGCKLITILPDLRTPNLGKLDLSYCEIISCCDGCSICLEEALRIYSIFFFLILIFSELRVW